MGLPTIHFSGYCIYVRFSPGKLVHLRPPELPPPGSDDWSTIGSGQPYLEVLRARKNWFRCIFSLPGDSSRDLFGMVSSRDPFKGWIVTSNDRGWKGHFESPGRYYSMIFRVKLWLINFEKNRTYKCVREKYVTVRLFFHPWHQLDKLK